MSPNTFEIAIVVLIVGLVIRMIWMGVDIAGLRRETMYFDSRLRSLERRVGPTPSPSGSAEAWISPSSSEAPETEDTVFDG